MLLPSCHIWKLEKAHSGFSTYHGVLQQAFGNLYSHVAQQAILYIKVLQTVDFGQHANIAGLPPSQLWVFSGHVNARKAQDPT